MSQRKGHQYSWSAGTSPLSPLCRVSALCLGCKQQLCLQSLQKHLRHRGTWEAMVLTWEMDDHPRRL